ncbi:DUF6234 family protein [Cellulomonas sp. PS-H5]|uniref:DUF6234 family protein n=1 Tax=Cellulomonas sp. PS-H5 TaxID=2820400 RepID=UPI001C4EA17E|nr:DUF6234 family protein [Cellulomonas sp. PS-H5]MBW0253124.1 hypothetical protein [Cellulomonas sp. PS-H5]
MAEARLDDDRDPARPAPPDPGAHAVRDRRRSDRARVVEVVALLGGAALIPVLFWQYLDVYLAFFGEQNVASPADGTRYVVTATACVALLLVGTGAAIIGEHTRAVVAGTALLAVGLVAAVLFAVPSDRFAVDPPDNRPGPDYVPCYSGSGDCPGG